MEEERDWITDRLADREGLGHTSGTIAEATRNRSDEAPHLSSKSLTHDIHSSQSEVRESTGACTFSEGTVLAGRYVLMKHVAGGGTCDVYRARDLMAVQRGAAEQSYVAIKLLKPALVARLGSADAVLDEALITRHLSHPNIIKVFDYYVESCEEGDRHFVAMEWVEGETLSERLDRMPHRIMPYSQVLRVFEDIASALSAAHAVGIIHADLKPSNILIGLDGRVKVIDFATARGARVARWRQGGSSREMAALEARRGFFAYTEGYASDAIKNDEAVTVQDDVYAFATMLYEALSGRAPNERQSNNWPKPRSVRYTQWPVLSRVLKPKARKRWSDVEAFFRAFTRARHQDRVIALLFLGGLIAGLAVWQGARSAIQFQAYMETLAQSDRNMITATDMADHISNAPVKALPVVLGEVRVLPELLSAGVLRVTSPGVFSRLEQYVDEALSEKAVNDF
ncbi:MAG: serine/threonine-protein kinase, partial [Gammaproteobacteria bacterium]